MPFAVAVHEVHKMITSKARTILGTMRSRFSCGLLSLPLQSRLVKPLRQRRFFFSARTQFINIDDRGIKTSSETEIRIGEPEQAFIYIEPELGETTKSTVIRKTGMHVPPTVAIFLEIFLDSCAIGTVPYPRVQNGQDLPRQATGDTSPATLWTSANWHAITLDGSPEEEFERLSRESGEYWKDLLEMLSRT